jgi:hypothetical protein
VVSIATTLGKTYLETAEKHQTTAHKDGIYEGANQVVLIEAKYGSATNTIIRQLYYPIRQWQNHTTKPVSTLFFRRTKTNEYHLWHFGFDDPNDYNSIRFLKSARHKITLLHG